MSGYNDLPERLQEVWDFLYCNRTETEEDITEIRFKGAQAAAWIESTEEEFHQLLKELNDKQYLDIWSPKEPRPLLTSARYAKAEDGNHYIVQMSIELYTHLNLNPF